MPEFLGQPMRSLGPYWIRDGVRGKYLQAELWECPETRTLRLDESVCLADDAYTGLDYREMVGEAPNVGDFYQRHDAEQPLHLSCIPWTRGATVADVGCAAGSLLDFLKGVSARTIAVEPCTVYHHALHEKGHELYALPEQVAEGVADHVYSLNTIEHITDPLAFIRALARIASPTGMVTICTPLHQPEYLDLPGDFLQNFLRRQHRWYFTVAGLRALGIAAGLQPYSGHGRGAGDGSGYVYASFVR